MTARSPWTIPRAWGVAGALTVALGAVPVRAQSAGPGRLDLSAGGRWIGITTYPAVTAVGTAPGGATRTLFESRTSLERSVGPALGVTVHVWRIVHADAAFVYSPTHLSTAVTGDVEGAADARPQARVQQYLAEGGVQVRPVRWRPRHMRPFASAGLGYVRQLYEARTLVVSGRAYYAGGGLYYERQSAPPSFIKATGLRADVRALFVREGVAPDSRTRPAPSVTAVFFARF